MNKYLTGKYTICLLIAFCIYGCALQAATPISEMKSFSIYALSRGTGVPATTKETFNQIESMLTHLKATGTQVIISKSRIGIEGETKLCVVFSDVDIANDLLYKVQSMAKGIDLINIKVEPCSTQP